MNRNEIAELKIGDKLASTIDLEPFSNFTKLKPNARFGEGREIVKISVLKYDVYGKLFIMGETTHGPNATITFSIKEGEVLYKKVG